MVTAQQSQSGFEKATQLPPRQHARFVVRGGDAVARQVRVVGTGVLVVGFGCISCTRIVSE